MRARVILFLVACALGGAGGLLGSILGNLAGNSALFAGGVLGGLLATACVGTIARSRRWIPAARARSTSVGAMIGFAAAALVATQTLGSPVGPVLSVSLIGIGAILGAGRTSVAG